MDGYKFDFAVSAEIASGTIKEMIKAVVEEQTGRKVKRISFKITNQSYSYRDEPGTPTLTGCTVHFE